VGRLDGNEDAGQRDRGAVKVVCSYCQGDLGEKEPLDNPAVSHGMCTACHAHFRRQRSGLSLSEYLDAFTCPVVVVDQHGRTVAVNQPMGELLGRASEELLGLLGGEALECAHARKPGGCGRTVHCRTCAIRNSVTATFQTGEPCVRVPASIVRQEGRVGFFVSTYRRGQVVQVVVETLPDSGAGLEAPSTDSQETPALILSLASGSRGSW